MNSRVVRSVIRSALLVALAAVLASVRLQTGSLYRHLALLIEQGLVAEGPAPRQVEDARRGTHYRLTSRGRQALDQERRYLAGVMAMLGGLRANGRKESL